MIIVGFKDLLGKEIGCGFIFVLSFVCYTGLFEGFCIVWLGFIFGCVFFVGVRGFFLGVWGFFFSGCCFLKFSIVFFLRSYVGEVRVDSVVFWEVEVRVF